MRIRIALTVLAVIIFGIFYIAIYPFLFEYHDIKNFCDSISEKQIATLEEVKNEAHHQYLSYIEDKKENRLTIYDKKTIGKTTCFIIESNGKLTTGYMGE